MSVWALGQESEQGTHEQKEVTDMGACEIMVKCLAFFVPQFTQMLRKVAGLSPDPFPQT